MEDVRILHQVLLKLLGLASDRVVTAGGGFTLEALLNLTGGYFTLSTLPSVGLNNLQTVFKLPPKLEPLNEIVGTDSVVLLEVNGHEEVFEVKVPEIRIRGFMVYVEANFLENGDEKKKSIRADKIRKIQVR
jgi:hypothetical protein